MARIYTCLGKPRYTKAQIDELFTPVLNKYEAGKYNEVREHIKDNWQRYGRRKEAIDLMDDRELYKLIINTQWSRLGCGEDTTELFEKAPKGESYVECPKCGNETYCVKE